ncbi:hypothetical protein ACLOJK_035671, partial [Asimina triloba]
MRCGGAEVEVKEHYTGPAATRQSPTPPYPFLFIALENLVSHVSGDWMSLVAVFRPLSS